MQLQCLENIIKTLSFSTSHFVDNMARSAYLNSVKHIILDSLQLVYTLSSFIGLLSLVTYSTYFRSPQLPVFSEKTKKNKIIK